jgi:hypothetical protein
VVQINGIFSEKTWRILHVLIVGERLCGRARPLVLVSRAASPHYLRNHVSWSRQPGPPHFVLLHHNTKTSVRQNNHKPARLDNLAWSGYAEWARQWILLGRREDYVEGSGLHDLWMNVGGSAGYSSLWALDVDEGFSGGRPHHWKVALSTPSEVCEKKEARKADSHRQRILEAAKKFPDGDTMSVILATAGVKHDKKASAFMETLVEEGALRHKKVEKKGVTYDGFCLAQAV